MISANKAYRAIHTLPTIKRFFVLLPSGKLVEWRSRSMANEFAKNNGGEVLTEAKAKKRNLI